jgi:predicted GNAT superfamily acetyltransferase
MKTRFHESPSVRIRRLIRYFEFEKILDIQRHVWKHDDEDLTPIHQFCITSRMGAILLGVYVGERLAGFVYSFPAVFNGKLIQHSHLLAVLPQYRGLGLGKRLKWAQRETALKQGYDLISWTVDPLQARNANLNIHALGAVTRTYLGDFYGRESALILGPGIPTDRFLMEWPIKEKRVEERRKNRFDRTDLTRPVKALERAAESGKIAPVGRKTPREKPEEAFIFPAKPRLGLDDRRILAEVPPDINRWRGKHEPIASWQAGLRRVFEHYFRQGYAVTDFVYGERCFYVLDRRARRPSRSSRGRYHLV